MKSTILVFLSLVILGSLFGYGVYRYNQRPKAAPTTVALSKYQATVDTLATHDRVNEHNLALKQQQIDSLTVQRNTLCSKYKTARVVIDPSLCQ